MGQEKLTEKQKKLLKDFTNKKCELCKKKFSYKELEIHRIKRGNKGGKYELRNVMVLCRKCHKQIHSEEF